MTVCLNKDACIKNNITVGELLFLMIVNNKDDIEKIKKSLIERGFITTERDKEFNTIGWRVTNTGLSTMESVFIDSERQTDQTDEDLIELATQLKEIYPKGKKEGTNYYWADGTALITRRLKIFFKKYGNKYTNDQILQATKKYVRSFNGSYQYMKLLKYFIFKEKLGLGRDIESDSELINYIENEDQKDMRDDWVSSLK